MQTKRKSSQSQECIVYGICLFESVMRDALVSALKAVAVYRVSAKFANDNEKGWESWDFMSLENEKSRKSASEHRKQAIGEGKITKIEKLCLFQECKSETLESLLEVLNESGVLHTRISIASTAVGNKVIYIGSRVPVGKEMKKQESSEIHDKMAKDRPIPPFLSAGFQSLLDTMGHNKEAAFRKYDILEDLACKKAKAQ